MSGSDLRSPESPAAPESASAFVAPGPASARVRVAVLACTGLALAVGFAHLQRRSLGHEEGYTWSTVDRGFPALISVLARAEGYQILHSLIEWPVNRISSTIDALRTPSVLAFGAAVPAIWLAGRRLFDERTGLLAALLFALNGFALQYAQQARGYMLATMLCAYSAALLAQYVFAPRRWSRVAWIVVSALAIYAHGFAVLAIASQVAALWFLAAPRRRELRWIRSGLLIALCAAPALLAPVLQVNGGEFGFSAKPGIAELRDLVWDMAGRTSSAVPVIGFGVVIALVAAVKVLRRSLHSDDAFRFAMPFLWMIVPSFVLFAGSYLHPIWLDRYVLWSVGAVVLMAAYGLTRIVPKQPAVVALVFVVAAGLAARGVIKWYSEAPYQDYHSAMTELAARARPGDAIMFSPDEARLPATFYLRNLVDLDHLTPVYPDQPWGKFKTGDQKVKPVTQAAIERALAHPYRRLWIVADAEPGVIPTHVNELRAGYNLVSDRFYTGPLEVVLLVPRG
jgi:mannosyltransferase